MQVDNIVLDNMQSEKKGKNRRMRNTDFLEDNQRNGVWWHCLWFYEFVEENFKKLTVEFMAVLFPMKTCKKPKFPLVVKSLIEVCLYNRFRYL